MATGAYGLKGNTNYVITSNTLYEIGRNYRINTTAPTPVAVPNNWSQVKSGWYHGLGIQSNGTLWAWGNNAYGQLGTNNQFSYVTPVQVGTESYWTNIAGSGNSSLAIQSNGTLWAWGRNLAGESGLGDSVSRSSPTQVGGLSSWTQIACGYAFSLALQNNGTLWAWGQNNFGQLGLSDTVIRSSPVQVGTLSTWTSVTAKSYFGAATQSGGTLWTWGLNSFGQLGTRNQINTSSPVQVGPAQTVAYWNNVPGTYGQQGSGAYAFPNSVAIQSNGTLWVWGQGFNGSMGLNTTTALFSSPVQVGALSTWTQVACGYAHTLALQNNGTLWAWGYNNNGQLGTGNVTALISPLQVGALSNWARLTATYWSSLAIKSDGTLWSWGNNSWGQLGTSNQTNYSSPVQVGVLSNWAQVTLGYWCTIALKTDGTLWTWGNNASGQLGSSNTTNRSSPVQVGALTSWAQAAFGQNYALAIQSNGTLWGWGVGADGCLGNNSTTVFYSPIQIGSSIWRSVFPAKTAASLVNYVMGIQSNGTLWAWGNNSWGQLGISNQVNYSSPVQVGVLSNWASASTSGWTLATQSDGTLWSWGNNTLGQLGINTSANFYSSPLQVGSSTLIPAASYKSIATTATSLTAVQSNGTLWSIGNNSFGQLGLNTTTAAYSSPVQVAPLLGMASTWSQVTGGNNHVVGIQSDGTLWSWGLNSYGQLGVGSAGVNIISPVQVRFVSTWSQISCGYVSSFSIQSNGTLWSWGATSWNLGYNGTSYTSSAIQIGAAGAWNRMPTGSQNNIWGAAINSNNNLYVWGINSNRLLNYNYYYYDTNDTTTQCGTLLNPLPLDPTLSTPIKSVSIGDQYGVYVQSNGTLWAWGNISYGQIPQVLGTVPTLVWMNNWTKVLSNNGVQYAAGIQSNGTLWAWGNNSWGQLGTSNQASYTSPNPITFNPSRWTDFSTGIYQMGGLQSPGTLWMWGNNSYGQLGQNNQNTAYSSPTQVGTTSIWSKLAVGDFHTHALQSDGTLWAWGYNGFGQLAQNNIRNYSSPVQIGGLVTAEVWTQMAAFGQGVHVLQSNGTLWAWGTNANGALGNNTTSGFVTPIQITGVSSGWKSLLYGGGQGLAILSNGTLWGCGYNTAGQLGLNNQINPVRQFTQIGTLSNWAYATISGTNSYALKTDGTIWSWGANGSGQLGQSNTTTRSSPVQIGANTDWVAVDGGSLRFLGIRAPGTMWTCGYNQSTAGQLGLGYAVNTTVYSPTQIGVGTSWARIAAGFYSNLAIQSNGTLWAWGYNVQGNLGLGDITQRSVPVQVGLLSNWSAVYVGSKNAAASSFSMALKTDGTLWAWGNNSYGQLGLNTTINYSSPVQVPTSTLGGWAQVSCGYTHTVLLISNNTLWTCGYNGVGQLGIGTSGSAAGQRSPVQVGSTPSPLSTAIWNDTVAGNNHSLGVQSGGTLWAWGNNSWGQLGILTQTNYSSPVQITAYSNAWSQISNGSWTSVAIRNSGTLWAWGNNSWGQAGVGSAGENILSPVQIGSRSTWASIGGGLYSTLACQTIGSLWAWGNNSWGQLGLNTTTHYSSPVAVGGLNNWKIVASSAGGNFSSLAIQTNGTLWAWGNNSWGQLGLNTTTHYSSPVQVGALTTWSKISCGYYHTAAIASTGTLWTWGGNSNGQLGVNTTIASYSSPVQVGALTSWLQVATGGLYTIAVQSNGTLWAWGENIYGQLGTSNTTSYSSPVQVGILSTWSNVSCGYSNTIAIKNDGTLWAWGRNNTGQLGLGNLANYSSPAQVGTDKWIKTASGGFYTTAIKSDGSIWAWGANSYGSLGNNSTTDASSPIATAGTSTTAATNWIQISAGLNYSAALQSNGTLWMWGNNSWGVLGQGDLIHRSSPVQITQSTNWATVATGAINAAAVQSNGTLWMWGNNNYSQLGNNTIVSPALSPAQVGTLSTWSSVACGYGVTAGINTSKLLYAWGTGATLYPTAFISPVQISTTSLWSSVAVGVNYALAIQSNGTLWGWGLNSFGQLGNNSMGTSSSILQIGTISNWAKVACGVQHTVAVQSNGTLWAWGNNSFGQLGQGNYTFRSSPVQVGTINSYVNVYAMNYTTLAEIQ